jgi:hypothetical protein
MDCVVLTWLLTLCHLVDCAVLTWLLTLCHRCGLRCTEIVINIVSSCGLRCTVSPDFVPIRLSQIWLTHNSFSYKKNIYSFLYTKNEF